MDNPAPQQQQHHDAKLQEFFEICQRIYEQMERDGTWPWSADSTNPEDVIDSESDHSDL